MTSFVDDNGNYLDYSGDDFGVTKQAASWFEFKIKGDISVDFKLPNTAKNRKALGYYGAQQISSPAFSSSTWNVVRNGNRILRGSLVIKGSDNDFINVFFLSGNSNWFQLLQLSLKEIDFADRFNVLIDSFNTQKSNTEGIIFPLVDWWAQGQHRSTVFIQRPNQTQEIGPVFSELQPCVYMHTVLTELANSTGIKVSGDLLTDPLFKQIIITPIGPDLFWPDWVVNESKLTVYCSGNLYSIASDPQVVQFNDVRVASEINTFDITDYSFRAPRTAAYEFDFKLAFLPSAAGYRIDLYIDGVLDSALYNGTDIESVIFYRSLTRGQKVQWYVTRTSGATDYRITQYSRVRIKVVKSIGTFMPSTYYTVTGKVPYVCPMAIVPDIKGIDFIKFLTVYFGCVCTYDEYSKTLSLNKISKIKREDAQDWSDYILDLKLNYQTGVSQHNYLQMQEGEEDQMKAYNDQSKVTYGGGDIETPFDASFEREAYKAPFSLSWDVTGLSANSLLLPFVKFYDLQFEEEVTYSGVASSAGLAGDTSSKFTCTFNNDISGNSVFFVKSDSGYYTGFATCVTSDTSTTNPTLGIPYGATDTGTIVKYSLSPVNSNSRILICRPATNLSDAGGGTIYYYNANDNASYGSATTGAVAWSDKPTISNQVIDTNFDSLAIDHVNNRTYNHTIGQRYHGPIENAFNNPKIEATMLIPVKVSNAFSYGYVRIVYKNLKGYFWVNKIDNYKDAETPVKVELLYVD